MTTIEIERKRNQNLGRMEDISRMLAKTDYKVLKAYEIGTQITDSVKTERAALRTEYNALEAENAALAQEYATAYEREMAEMHDTEPIATE